MVNFQDIEDNGFKDITRSPFFLCVGVGAITAI